MRQPDLPMVRCEGRPLADRGVHPRHTRLAVGAAATLATFVFETHEARDSDHTGNGRNALSGERGS